MFVIVQKVTLENCTNMHECAGFVQFLYNIC